MEEALVNEFQEFHIKLENGSPLLDRLRDLAVENGLTANELCADWVAYAVQHGSCDLTDTSCDEWATKLAIQSKTLLGNAGKKRSVAGKQVERKVHTKSDLNELFADDLIGQYGTQEDVHKCGVKRSSEEATPPSSTHKVRATESVATPTTPLSRRQQSSVNTNPGHNGFVVSTPVGSYTQRKNSGTVICSLNERGANWRGRKQEVKVSHYDITTALTTPYHHMFQKVSDKALALLERTEALGGAICQHHSLPDPLPLSQPSLESAVYVGHVVCDGEGHLNAGSCLLEAPVRSRTLHSHTVRLEIPSNLPCSLFPGQVLAVEGVNNYSGTLIPSVIYDRGVCPPLPGRTQGTIGGFTALAAAGPFSTSDSLDMAPLNDIITMVTEEEPHVLLLMGPYVDVNNSIVKTGCLPGDLTLQEFFTLRVLEPLLDTISGLRTQVLLVPSQRDAHHPFEVYPQPPFEDTCLNPLKRDKAQVLFLPDPCTLSINGVCIGATSTDILFHLSARTMFRGRSGDRMARLAGHLIRQQCYYPLVPPYLKEVPSIQVKAEANGTNSDVPRPQNDVPRPPSEACDINLDYVQAFEEGHASMPARPDILLLPSDLKPFVKVLDGCVCINPGHLTRKITGGTFVKLVVPELPAKPDLSSDVSVSVVHI